MIICLKKACPRLREIMYMAWGKIDSESHKLGPTFLPSLKSIFLDYFRVVAAKVIQKMWRAYKTRRLLKAKRRKKRKKRLV